MIFPASKPAVAGGPADISDLDIGDSAVFQVQARICANPTFLRVTKGTQYQFFVPPGQRWTDLFIGTDANGYANSPISCIQDLFRGLKPLPEKNWFALAGAIDRPRNAPFLIGNDRNPIVMKADGQLILFANDAAGFYWNNFGSLLVAITRTK